MALALLWKYQDGYLARIPVWLQRCLLGGLAALAHRTGYERRWLPAAPLPVGDLPTGHGSTLRP
ncbi:hypothetical protein [Nocardia yunnanensis]|uniref:hypothetical protein n=1 Tax=Nocardia yunnanensis TaxID=2382165 RepID=UPI001FE32B19|nr:hypothetical protein [Nocardia yunnanensis]